MKRDLFLNLLTFLIVVSHQQVRAQETSMTKSNGLDSVVSIQLEGTTTQRHLHIMPGKTIRYRVRASDHFQKAMITAITDSTVSFLNGQKENTTLRLGDLDKLIIPRSIGRQTFGFFTLTFATASIVTGLVLVGEENDQSTNTFIIATFVGGGFLGILNATFLLKGRRIDLTKAWKLKIVKVANPGFTK